MSKNDEIVGRNRAKSHMRPFDRSLSSGESHNLSTISHNKKKAGFSKASNMGISDASDEKMDEVVENRSPDARFMTNLDPFEQLKRIKEDEWKNIPKVVKYTFRLLIDFTLDEKKKYDKSFKKLTNNIERNNTITTRTFKQYTDQINMIEKTTNDRLKLTEVTSNNSMINMKESLNKTISSFNMQIKDVLGDNRVMADRVRQVIADSELTTETVNNIKSELMGEIRTQTGDSEFKLNKRISNLIEQNLTIPGILDDPEGTNGEIESNRTLKDYILNEIEAKQTTNESITVSDILQFTNFL